MSNRANIEAMNAELAGVQCRVDQLSELMQKRSIGEVVSRREFNEFNEHVVATIDKLASAFDDVLGMYEKLVDQLAEAGVLCEDDDA